MKARLILIAVAGALLGTLALAPPAEAGHSGWSFGVGFHAGGLHFRIGFAPHGYSGYPGPFFLTTSRLHHRGYGCHGACFRSGAGYYHHASCPLLGLHFRRGGYGPDHYLRSYSPYRGYGPYWGYGSRYYRYPGRAYGYYYRDGHRDRFRHYGGRHYRDRHYRDHRHRGYRGDHRYRHDRGRRDWDHDSDSDSDRGRHYRPGDRHRGGRDHARPRGGAARTRPPR